MEWLSLLFNKISPYNILNNFIPGVVLWFLLKSIVGWDFICHENWVVSVILFYFAGEVNSRVGSLLIEKGMKRYYGELFCSYEDYIKAEREDATIKILNTQNNIYRSFVAVCLIVFLSLVWSWVVVFFPVLSCIEKELMIVLLFVVFMFSYVKQTTYVAKRVSVILKELK